MQAIHEPLEAYRHFVKLALVGSHHPVDHGRGHQRLADLQASRPLWAVGDQVIDAHGQKVVRVHQATGINYTVAIGIGVVAKSDIKAIFNLE